MSYDRSFTMHSRSNRPRLAFRRLVSLGISFVGAGSMLCGIPSAVGAEARAVPGKGAETVGRDAEAAYWDRNDRFEDKLKLLEAAWRNKDYDLARALTHSLRDSVIHTQAEEQDPGAPVLGASDSHAIATLPKPWRAWAEGWSHYQVLTVGESQGLDRTSEPVEVLIAVPAGQSASLVRELRMARIREGRLEEVTIQPFGELRRGGQRFCRILFQADVRAREKVTYLLLYGNPHAEIPEYPSDLITRGEGVGLDIENEHFKLSLSRQTGQLERLVFKREHGLELYSGGEGHGEPPGIDWAHDYVDAGNFQKLRISLWESSPEFEVIRGPVCTVVRRWGFPRSPVHPIFTPSRLEIAVEYRFYAGLPWFHKIGTMKAVKDFEAQALRDDEWVFSGHSFTDKAWMDAEGVFHSGEVDAAKQEDLWGVGFFNRQSKDAFMALFLEHRAEGIPPLHHTGVPTLAYRWHGQLWSRYPLPVKQIPAGAVLHQKNAYAALPYEEAQGFKPLETLYQCLKNPLIVASAGLDAKGEAKETRGQLAREGERGGGRVSKEALWQALRDCKDAQLYTADINVVDLGLIYDLRVRGDAVTVVMTMPHKGRPVTGYFAQGSISVHPTLSVPILERLKKVPGVRKVVVERTWSPAWSSNQLTDEGRHRLGLPALEAGSR